MPQVKCGAWELPDKTVGSRLARNSIHPHTLYPSPHPHPTRTPYLYPLPHPPPNQSPIPSTPHLTPHPTRPPIDNDTSIGIICMDHIVQLYRPYQCRVICLAEFEQNGQPKERSNFVSKMGYQNGHFEFLDCMAQPLPST